MLTTIQNPNISISSFALQELSLVEEWPKIRELVKLLKSSQRLHYTDKKGIKYIIDADNAGNVLMRLEIEVN